MFQLGRRLNWITGLIFACSCTIASEASYADERSDMDDLDGDWLGVIDCDGQASLVFKEEFSDSKSEDLTSDIERVWVYQGISGESELSLQWSEGSFIMKKDVDSDFNPVFLDEARLELVNENVLVGRTVGSELKSSCSVSLTKID